MSVPHPKLAAFLGIAKTDRENPQLRQTLQEFKRRLSGEVQAQISGEFKVFDVEDALFGTDLKNFRSEIIESVLFFIPIMTPAFFEDQDCTENTMTYIEREKTFSIDGLILPVYFIQTKHLESPDQYADNKLVQSLCNRKYFDWRSLRFQDSYQPEAMGKLGQQIRNVVENVEAKHPLLISEVAKKLGQHICRTIEGAEKLSPEEMQKISSSSSDIINKIAQQIERERERYTERKLLSKGGYSTTYLARDTENNCAVVIKQSNADDEKQRALLSEILIYNKLEHPLLPKVLDHFFEQGKICVVTEYIPGKDIQDYMGTESKPLSVSLAIEWVSQLLEILSFLHTYTPHPIVHLDIKPSNIRIHGQTGQVYLLDLGIARSSDQKHSSAGSRGYAAPEQYKLMNMTPAADIYAVGATLYHLLTGIVPPESSLLENVEETLELPAHANSCINADLEELILTAMELDPAKRFQNASEMLTALQTIQIYQKPVLAPVRTYSAHSSKPARTPEPVPEPEPALAPEPEPISDIRLPNCRIQLAPGCIVHVPIEGLTLSRKYIEETLPTFRALMEKTRWQIGGDSPLRSVSRSEHCIIFLINTTWCIRAFQKICIHDHAYTDGELVSISSSTTVLLGGSKGWPIDILIEDY